MSEDEVEINQEALEEAYAKEEDYYGRTEVFDDDALDDLVRWMLYFILPFVFIIADVAILSWTFQWGMGAVFFVGFLLGWIEFVFMIAVLTKEKFE